MDTVTNENVTMQPAVKMNGDSSKLAESMPVDPGELNICLACE